MSGGQETCLQISMDQIQVVQKSYTSKELASKILDVGAREGSKTVRLQEVEDTGSEKICYNTDVVEEIEAVAQMNALVAVVLIVHGEGGQDSKFNPRSVTILLHGADDLDCTLGALSPIVSFDNLAKSTLTEKLDDLIWVR